MKGGLISGHGGAKSDLGEGPGRAGPVSCGGTRCCESPVCVRRLAQHGAQSRCSQALLSEWQPRREQKPSSLRTVIGGERAPSKHSTYFASALQVSWRREHCAPFPINKELWASHVAALLAKLGRLALGKSISLLSPLVAAPVQSAGLVFLGLQILILPPSRVPQGGPGHPGTTARPLCAGARRGPAHAIFSTSAGRWQVLTAEPFHAAWGQTTAGSQGQSSSSEPENTSKSCAERPGGAAHAWHKLGVSSAPLMHRAPDCATLTQKHSLSVATWLHILIKMWNSHQHTLRNAKALPPGGGGCWSGWQGEAAGTGAWLTVALGPGSWTLSTLYPTSLGQCGTLIKCTFLGCLFFLAISFWVINGSLFPSHRPFLAAIMFSPCFLK